MEQSTQSQQTTKKRGCLYYGGMGCLTIIVLSVVMMIILAAMGMNSLDKAKEKAQQNKAAYDAEHTNDNANTNTEQVTVQPTAEVQPVFDLEALYGKNIDEVRNALGKPVDGAQSDPTAQQIQLGVTQWDNTFKKDGYELVVTYEVSSKKVIDFFIGTNDQSGQTKDVEPLKQIGNVADTTHFTIEPVKVLNDSSYFTGIKVIPNK